MSTSPYADHTTTRLINHLKITSASARKFYTSTELANMLGIARNTLSYRYYRGKLGIKPMKELTDAHDYFWDIAEVDALVARERRK
jgi:hypothetical protein